MKNISVIKSLFLTGMILILVGGCTKDFNDINTDPNAATTVPATNVFARGILSSAGTLFGERLDIYYTGSYAGQTAAIGLGDYEYRVDINNSMWRSMYIAMTYLNDAANIAKKEENTNLVCGSTHPEGIQCPANNRYVGCHSLHGSL